MDSMYASETPIMEFNPYNQEDVNDTIRYIFLIDKERKEIILSNMDEAPAEFKAKRDLRREAWANETELYGGCFGRLILHTEDREFATEAIADLGRHPEFTFLNHVSLGISDVLVACITGVLFHRLLIRPCKMATRSHLFGAFRALYTIENDRRHTRTQLSPNYQERKYQPYLESMAAAVFAAALEDKYQIYSLARRAVALVEDEECRFFFYLLHCRSKPLDIDPESNEPKVTISLDILNRIRNGEAIIPVAYHYQNLEQVNKWLRDFKSAIERIADEEGIEVITWSVEDPEPDRRRNAE